MHFEILVEDISGKALLEEVVPRIIDLEKNTFRVISYRGIGRLPKDLTTHRDPAKRILLEQLPRLLRGYGKSWRDYDALVLVVVDSDRRDCISLKQELNALLDQCEPKPQAYFRIAVEEMEAWLLGDKDALLKAYPKMISKEYESYRQDSIFGTWEKLADMIYPGGAAHLSKKPYFEIGKQKCLWASAIGKEMDVLKNRSASYNCFRDLLRSRSSE